MGTIADLDPIVGMVPATTLLEVEGPLASDDSNNATPIQLGALFIVHKTEDYNAVAGDLVLADTDTDDSFSVTLPAAPLINQRIGVSLDTKTTAGRQVTISRNGKNIGGAAANLILNVEGWGVVLRYDGTDNWVIEQDTRRPVRAYIRDQKATGTDGGTFTATGYRQRDLNTEVYDEGGNVAVASNEFTLDPGVYLITAKAPCYLVANNFLRLYNVTDASVAGVGRQTYSPTTSDPPVVRARIDARIEITEEKDFRLDHYCATTRASDGFGFADAYSTTPEVYSEVFITKVN